jgi:FecR-like protein
MSNERLIELREVVSAAAPTPGARERVWARLQAAPRPGPARWPAAALCSAVAAVALAVIWPRHAPPDGARLMRLSGQVAMVGGGRRTAGLERAPIDRDSWIETGRGQVLAGADRDYLIWAREDTQFRVERQARDVVVHLTRGQVHIWSARRTSGALWVSTPHHRARVVGTVFSVQFSDVERFAVARGTVDVYDHDLRVAHLSAGESWASGGQPAFVPPETVAFLERAARGEAVELPAQPPRLDPAPPIPQARPAMAAPSAAAIRPAFVSGAPRAERAPGPATRPQPTAPAAAPTTAPAAPVAANPVAPVGQVVPSGPVPKESEADRLAREAEALERGGDFHGAAARYEAIAQGQGLDAEWALYRLGQLRERRLADPEGALRAWQEHRRRFPDGSLRQEAHLSIVETLVKLGRKHEALTEAERFLAEFPTSERRGELERLRTRLQE